MPAIETLVLLLAGLAFMAMLGFPFVRLALPDDLYDEFGHLIAAPVGYMLLCMFAFALSGGTGISAVAAIQLSMAAMAIATAVLLLRAKRVPALTFPRLRGRTLEFAMLILPLVVFMLWPLFVHGASTYLGAVNPDYFAGLVDDYFLLQGRSVADFSRGRDTYFPLDYLAGSISSSGRFASGLFALALAKLFFIDPRTALTLSIALFLCCLPLTLYFFCRTVFGFDKRTARVAAWLIGISAPVTMSYLYFYLGQNSGLPAVPLTLTAGFLLLTRPSTRLLVLFALLVNALLVVYLGMLPYALAPVGALALYLLATRRLAISRAAVLLGGFVLVTLVVNFGMLEALFSMMRGWGNVIGQTLQGQYFVDFLTEAFFPLFLGVVLYPYPSSWYFATFGHAALPFLVGATLLVGGSALLAGWRWIRAEGARDHSRLVTVVSAVVIYSVVWWVYSFARQYGYAVFKMSSWVQFMLVPFFAYGWHVVRGGSAWAAPAWLRTVLGVGVACYVFTNLFATLEYGAKGLGRDPTRGYIVNNYDMSGNRDYFAVGDAVKQHIAPGDSVGLSFVDSIQNFWVAYYLRAVRVSLLAHESIPGDDENLPDIFTEQVIDYYGNVRDAKNVFFHGAKDAYYLVWNEGHMNRDIVIPHFSKPPVWESRTFRLMRASENPDMTFSGRGFYRVEYSLEPKPYWWPERTRWSAEGGEVYLLRPSKRGTPYRVVLDGIVGFEAHNDMRVVELWANKVKFDTFTMHSATRYISKPFIPTEDVTKIVIKVQGKVPPTRRIRPLWNKNIPFDYRQLNMVFADIHVVPDGTAITRPGGPCGAELAGNDVLRCPAAFDGIQIDRWVGKRATLLLSKPAPKVTRMNLHGILPGSLGFRFPYAITFKVNGVETTREFPKAGPFEIELPVPEDASPTVALEIVGSQSKEFPDQFEIRRKVVSQAFRIESVELK